MAVGDEGCVSHNSSAGSADIKEGAGERLGWGGVLPLRLPDGYITAAEAAPHFTLMPQTKRARTGEYISQVGQPVFDYPASPEESTLEPGYTPFGKIETVRRKKKRSSCRKPRAPSLKSQLVKKLRAKKKEYTAKLKSVNRDLKSLQGKRCIDKSGGRLFD